MRRGSGRTGAARPRGRRPGRLTLLLSLVPAVEGQWLEWGAWSRCSVTCANGTQQRTRKCSVAAHGWAECRGAHADARECSNPSCPSKAPRAGGELGGGHGCCWHGAQPCIHLVSPPVTPGCRQSPLLCVRSRRQRVMLGISSPPIVVAPSRHIPAGGAGDSPCALTPVSRFGDPSVPGGGRSRCTLGTQAHASSCRAGGSSGDGGTLVGAVRPKDGPCPHPVLRPHPCLVLRPLGFGGGCGGRRWLRRDGAGSSSAMCRDALGLDRAAGLV